MGWDGLLAEHEIARAQGRIVGLGFECVHRILRGTIDQY